MGREARKMPRSVCILYGSVPIGMVAMIGTKSGKKEWEVSQSRSLLIE
jgi:hypothetical protein